MSSSLSKRLRQLMVDGSLTVRDLQRWLARPYPTVRMWATGGHEPWEVWREEIERNVSLLEHLVAKSPDFPIPASFSPSGRRELIERLANERDQRLSRRRSAARR